MFVIDSKIPKYAKIVAGKLYAGWNKEAVSEGRLDQTDWSEVAPAPPPFGKWNPYPGCYLAASENVEDALEALAEWEPALQILE